MTAGVPPSGARRRRRDRRHAGVGERGVGARQPAPAPSAGNRRSGPGAAATADGGVRGGDARDRNTHRRPRPDGNRMSTQECRPECGDRPVDGITRRPARGRRPDANAAGRLFVTCRSRPRDLPRGRVPAGPGVLLATASSARGSRPSARRIVGATCLVQTWPDRPPMQARVRDDQRDAGVVERAAAVLGDLLAAARVDDAPVRLDEDVRRARRGERVAGGRVAEDLGQLAAEVDVRVKIVPGGSTFANIAAALAGLVSCATTASTLAFD